MSYRVGRGEYGRGLISIEISCTPKRLPCQDGFFYASNIESKESNSRLEDLMTKGIGPLKVRERLEEKGYSPTAMSHGCSLGMSLMECIGFRIKIFNQTFPREVI